MNTTEPTYVLIPAGSRRVRLLDAPRFVPLDMLADPGACGAAMALLRCLNSITAANPAQPLVEIPVGADQPAFIASIDLWQAGLCRFIVWKDLETGEEGCAVTLLNVVQSEEGEPS
jgi:hypothetical protein